MTSASAENRQGGLSLAVATKTTTNFSIEAVAELRTVRYIGPRSDRARSPFMFAAMGVRALGPAYPATSGCYYPFDHLNLLFLYNRLYFIPLGLPMPILVVMQMGKRPLKLRNSPQILSLKFAEAINVDVGEYSNTLVYLPAIHPSTQPTIPDQDNALEQ
jgi:hypothetical protein